MGGRGVETATAAGGTRGVSSSEESHRRNEGCEATKPRAGRRRGATVVPLHPDSYLTFYFACRRSGTGPDQQMLRVLGERHRARSALPAGDQGTGPDQQPPRAIKAQGLTNDSKSLAGDGWPGGCGDGDYRGAYSAEVAAAWPGGCEGGGL